MATTLLRAARLGRQDGCPLPGRVPWRGNVQGFVSIVLFCCACDCLLPVRIGLAFAGMVYGSWSLWLGVREARSTVLGVNPLATYQMWQAATLGLYPMYVAFNYSVGDRVPFGPRFALPDQIAYGHAILVVGALALYLGMKQFQPREIPRGRGVLAPSGWELLACFVGGATILIFSYQITASMGSVFASLCTMPLAVLSLCAMNPPAGLRRSPGAFWVVLLVGTIILLLLNGRADSKMMLSFSFVPLALAVLRRKKASLLIAFLIGFAAFYILVIAPLVWNMRNAVQRNEQGEKSVLDQGSLGNVQAQLQSDFRDDPIQYLSMWIERTMCRLGDPLAAGIVSEYVATDGLLRGAGMNYVPISFIPRMFWRDKPIIERGKYFTNILGMSSDESSATTSTGQTAAGELYWNFGWPGVMVGMYLLGVAFSGAWWGADGGDPTNGAFEMTAFMGITLSFVLGAGSAAGTGFVGAISSGIVLRALIRVRNLMLRRSPRTHAGRCRSGSPIGTCK